MKTQLDLISIVIPIYNSEKYLRQCLNSVVSQTYNNIEILLVDDGSTDGSIQIEEEFAKKDSRICIIKQKNQYAGVARNNGLMHASGKYILFLDSDDYFDRNMVLKSYRYAEKFSAQIVMFGYYEYNDKTGKELKAPFKFRSFINKVRSPKQFKELLFILTEPVPWNKLINLKFLKENNLFYQNIRNGNDEFFNRMIVAVSERMVFINKRFVHYRVNNNNSLQGKLNVSNQDIECGLTIVSGLKNELCNRGMFNSYLRVAYNRFACDVIDSRIKRALKEVNTLKMFYNLLKNNLIPTYFLCLNDFLESEYLCTIYNSDSFESFLCAMLYKTSFGFVPETNLYYRIGKSLSFIPSRVIPLNVIKKIKRYVLNSK